MSTVMKCSDWLPLVMSTVMKYSYYCLCIMNGIIPEVNGCDDGVSRCTRNTAFTATDFWNDAVLDAEAKLTGNMKKLQHFRVGQATAFPCCKPIKTLHIPSRGIELLHGSKSRLGTVSLLLTCNMEMHNVRQESEAPHHPRADFLRLKPAMESIKLSLATRTLSKGLCGKT
jgi:hypothetical protein